MIWSGKCGGGEISTNARLLNAALAGHSSLFPILFQFKSELARYAKTNNPLCTIWFYLSDAVVSARGVPQVHAFRISPAERVHDVIVEVLSRVSATTTVLLPAKKCRLETEWGYKVCVRTRTPHAEARALYNLPVRLAFKRI